MADAGPAGLQGQLLIPSTLGKHPLVLMTHSNFGGGNRGIGPGILKPAALWFAQRGWAVVIVLRRGFGDSGGKPNIPRVGCGEAHLESVADEDARDLQAAYDFAALQPGIDPTQTIAVGNGLGGFSVVSFAMKAPPSLKAVIGFSIAWPDDLFRECKKKGFVPFTLGSGAQVPNLWVYPRKEHWSFPGPKTGTAFYEEFKAAGGNIELAIVDQPGEDGYFLFPERTQFWGPVVERYLAAQGLPSKALQSESAGKPLKLQAGFSDEAQAAYAQFQVRGPAKAFAVSIDQHWGYSYGRLTEKLAIDEALRNCGNLNCRILVQEGP